MMLPFVTTYDPAASSEGTLDPLGLYQIADQLAVELVPAVRERMQRIRFSTAIALGAVVTEGLEPNPKHPETTPFLVWEWLVVEAIVRCMTGDEMVLGVPGTLVTRRALGQYGYLDHRSYLKTPRIFGFHGVYKRLAIHLELADVHLGLRHPRGDRLIQAWARDNRLGRVGLGHDLMMKWRRAVERSLRETPVRTRTSWSSADWEELAALTSPHTAGGWEKRYLRDLLHDADTAPLGALPAIWSLQEPFDEDSYAEEPLHQRLKTESPEYAELLDAITAYESFCHTLQYAFDLLRAEAGGHDARGFVVTDMAGDSEFQDCAELLAEQFEKSHGVLGEVNLGAQGIFQRRFDRFGEPMRPAELALALCEHHEVIQRGKSAEGKRPWFDRLGADRIHVRHNYRVARPKPDPGGYVHDYRGKPIRSFWTDLQ